MRRGILQVLALSLGRLASADCIRDNCLNRIDCGPGCVADCSRWLAVTIKPSPITLTSTTSLLGDYESIITGAPEMVVSGGNTKKKRTCKQTTPFPFYAALCDDTARYASACGCLGVTATTKTASAHVVTDIHKYSVCKYGVCKYGIYKYGAHQYSFHHHAIYQYHVYQHGVY
ncbi:hypothetical protein G7054_g14240 [Neopestalotiopsis clavispora]|nr:hypothetical protein G7054_g14240 [Neopestalotiopsis clavispora]